jgi:hypothetical protein
MGRFSISLRRFEAASILLVMLAVPLTVMACIDRCSEMECPCCAAMSHEQAMHCRSDMSGNCAMSGRGEAQQLPAFFLAAHQARNMPVGFAHVVAPISRRAKISEAAPTLSSGFTSVPFEPPRS